MLRFDFELWFTRHGTDIVSINVFQDTVNIFLFEVSSRNIRWWNYILGLKEKLPFLLLAARYDRKKIDV